MDAINNLIDSLLSSFDFAYCLVVNILTYLVIKTIEGTNKQIKTWTKRIILLIIILSTGVLYKLIGMDTKLLINSSILAPVSWSWIFKPICSLLKIDYNNKVKEKQNEQE